MFRPVDIYQLSIDLYKGIAFPELYKNIRFPAPFSTPTFSFQQKTSFTADLNDKGNLLIQINMSQYLDASKFRTGITGNQNGNSVIGIFFLISLRKAEI